MMRFNSYAPTLALLTASASALEYNPSPTVTIDAGVLIGKATALPNGLGPSVNQFLGVPFAKSPPERFSPPQDVTAFSSQLNTTEWKPACIQQFRCKGPFM
jgi:acetylcholinesterase